MAEIKIGTITKLIKKIKFYVVVVVVIYALNPKWRK